MKTKSGSQTSKSSFSVVGVGASAGGLEALQELFAEMAPEIEMAFVVVQHTDPKHETLLPQLLARKTRLQVLSAKEGEKPLPGRIYIAPSDVILSFSDKRFRTTPRDPVRGALLAIDIMLRSLSEEFEECAAAVILSGGGSDGALGLQEVKAKGGITFAQDEVSARFFSMPHSAVITGSVDFVLPPKKIAEVLQRVANHEYVKSAQEVPPTTSIEEKNEDFQSVLALIHRASGIDFRHYKHATLSRRILRRMALSNVSNFPAYLKLLRESPTELAILSQDILIQVTKFFRDPEVFDVLKEKVFPALVNEETKNETIRIWVPGCSSGEEVYSTLICLLEYLEQAGLRHSVQMFGSDIGEKAILKAREGSYIENIAMDVSPERLRRFFTKVGNRYEINKNLRDLCIFARHNIVTDPPFGRLHLISCRNVLIYLEAPLQKKAVSVFHYGLKPERFLVLGNAETADPDLFAPLDSRCKIYRKKPMVSRLYFDYAGTQHAAERLMAPRGLPQVVDDLSRGLQIQREADRILLSEFVPPGVIISDALDVLQYRGHTGPFFEHSPGFATLQLLKMLKDGLVVEVRNTIETARKSGEPERREGLSLVHNGESRKIAIEVIPFSVPPAGERFFLLLFEDMDAPEYEGTKRLREAKQAARQPADEAVELSQLRAELASTKEYLQSINEEKEAANEELKAANEEIMSSNEELQSMNEELNTSKEELQSTNEELTTVNDELRLRNSELSQLNDDLSNLFNSLNSSVILLTKDFRIRKFTPMAEKLLRLIPADIGRCITDIKPNVDFGNFEEILNEVIATMAPRELDIEDRQGRWYNLQVRPYRTSDDRISGLVLLFSDITILKTSLIYAEAVENTLTHPLLVLSGGLTVNRANRSFYETFNTTRQDTEGKPIYQIGDGQWNIAELRNRLSEILQDGAEVKDFEVTHQFPGLGKKTMLLNARRLFYKDRATETILLAIEVKAS